MSEHTKSGAVIEGRGIIFGMPVYITGESCEAANWFAGLVLEVAIGVCGFNGAVMQYEGVGYWHALWWWLTDSEAEP